MFISIFEAERHWNDPIGQFCVWPSSLSRGTPVQRSDWSIPQQANGRHSRTLIGPFRATQATPPFRPTVLCFFKTNLVIFGQFFFLLAIESFAWDAGAAFWLVDSAVTKRTSFRDSASDASVPADRFVFFFLLKKRPRRCTAINR